MPGRDDPRLLDLRSLEFRVQMMQDVVDEGGPAAERTRPMLAEFQAVLAVRRGHPGSAPVAEESSYTEIGRRGGAPAANQYGKFTVHTASDRQVAFLRRLIAEKDTTGLTIPASLDGISKTSASALIDRLLGRGAPVRTGSAPSEKQMAFITRLLDEKDLDSQVVVVDGAELCGRTAWDGHVPALTSRGASKAIDALLSLPRRTVERAAEATVAAGAYRLPDGRVVRVYLGQQSGRMLAAELVDAGAEIREDAWRYLGLATRWVDGAARRMTVEECEAVAGGSGEVGWCCVCGKRLDDPNSVARGIGPVCRARQAG